MRFTKRNDGVRRAWIDECTCVAVYGYANDLCNAGVLLNPAVDGNSDVVVVYKDWSVEVYKTITAAKERIAARFEVK